jgi:hypothetical protein
MIKVDSRQYSLLRGSETVRQVFWIRCAIQKTSLLSFRNIARYPRGSGRSVGGEKDRIPDDDAKPGAYVKSGGGVVAGDITVKHGRPTHT